MKVSIVSIFLGICLCAASIAAVAACDLSSQCDLGKSDKFIIKTNPQMGYRDQFSCKTEVSSTAMNCITSANDSSLTIEGYENEAEFVVNFTSTLCGNGTFFKRADSDNPKINVLGAKSCECKSEDNVVTLTLACSKVQ